MPAKKTTAKNTATKATKKTTTKKAASNPPAPKAVKKTTKAVKKADLQVNGEKKVLLTKAGLQRIMDELERLKGAGRKEVAEKLKEAISYGDLSENAEYDEAKNQQAFLEARIIELEEQIKKAEIVEEKHTGEVTIGSVVTLRRTSDGDEHEYTMVGSTEADILSHKISNESPVGNAIMGKKAKDKVVVETPMGDLEYVVLKVK